MTVVSTQSGNNTHRVKAWNIHHHLTEMTSLCRNPGVLLLFLSASPLLHSHLLSHAASTSSPVTRPRIIYMSDWGSDHEDDDDDDYFDDPSPPPEVVHAVKTTLLQQKPQFCQYNPCLENQEPCEQMSAKASCLCPGVSGVNEPPHAPRIQELLPISEGDDRGKIEVQWCAPSSVVSRYRVVIEGGEALEFGEHLRHGLVGSLTVGTKVCVEAVNNAGHSTTTDFSCMRYDPPESSDHKLLAGIIGGGVALLLLIVIGAVILWKLVMYKKAKRDSADGLGNPSYNTEGTL